MYTRILVFFTVFLKNRNISSKIKRSKVTGYAASKGRKFGDCKEINVWKILVNARLKGRKSGERWAHIEMLLNKL